MQRRAAAVSVAFFLVVSAASYALIATAEEPTVDFEDPEYSLQEGDSFTAGGQEYTVTAIEATVESGDDGHGGGGGETVVRSGELSSGNETTNLDHLDNVTIGDQTYLVFFPNNDTVYLTQQFEAYDRQTAEIDQHHVHVNGLWGVSILSGLAAFALLGMAYLPSRY